MRDLQLETETRCCCVWERQRPDYEAPCAGAAFSLTCAPLPTENCDETLLWSKPSSTWLDTTKNQSKTTLKCQFWRTIKQTLQFWVQKMNGKYLLFYLILNLLGYLVCVIFSLFLDNLRCKGSKKFHGHAIILEFFGRFIVMFWKVANSFTFIFGSMREERA